MACPNINLLKSYKVYPQVIHLVYTRDKFFIYVYLDPFKELARPLEIKVQQETFCFAYEPFYIGKGTNAQGYRQNQHISAFINGKETNPEKKKKFQEIQEKMAIAAAKDERNKPWNWKEYQNNYIKILKTFSDPKALLRFEMEIINTVGTVYLKNGPLVNKIANAYSFGKLRTGMEPLL
jgi:hypothetical protein